MSIESLLEEGTPDDWTPKLHERSYMRDKQTGDLGYLVRRDGRDMVLLDRPNQEILRRYNTHDWAPDDDARKLSAYQVAHVAFMADKQLCRTQGLHDDARLEWEDMREEKRNLWIQRGPRGKGERLRQKLFTTIREALTGER